MNVSRYMIIIGILSVIGYTISKLFKDQLIMEQGYIIGTLLTSIVLLIFNNNKDKKLFGNSKKIFNLAALILAFVGGSLWFTGEFLVYIGKADHPLLDPIGAFSCALSALIALVLYLDN